jgi:hypothetical protein
MKLHRHGVQDESQIVNRLLCLIKGTSLNHYVNVKSGSWQSLDSHGQSAAKGVLNSLFIKSSDQPFQFVYEIHAILPSSQHKALVMRTSAKCRMLPITSSNPWCRADGDENISQSACLRT